MRSLCATLASARAIFDKQQPLAGDGYPGSLYEAYGRYWYVSISKKF